MAGFESAVHKDLFKKTFDLAARLYGDNNIYPGEIENEFCMWKGSTYIHVEVLPFPVQKGKHYLYAWAICTYETQYTPLLCRHLVDLNNKVFFGHFTFYEYKDRAGMGNIVFTYMMPCDDITKSQLDIAVYNVAFYADEYDDDFVKRFGGMTCWDASQKNKDKKDDGSGGSGGSGGTGGKDVDWG